MKFFCRASFRCKLAGESAETLRPRLTSRQKGRMYGSTGSSARCKKKERKTCTTVLQQVSTMTRLHKNEQKGCQACAVVSPLFSFVFFQPLPSRRGGSRAAVGLGGGGACLQGVTNSSPAPRRLQSVWGSFQCPLLFNERITILLQQSQ